MKNPHTHTDMKSGFLAVRTSSFSFFKLFYTEPSFFFFLLLLFSSAHVYEDLLCRLESHRIPVFVFLSFLLFCTCHTYIYIYIFVLWIHTFPSTFFFLFFCTHNPAREFLSCSIELACSKKGLCRAFNSLLFSLELRERTIYALKKKNKWDGLQQFHPGK